MVENQISMDMEGYSNFIDDLTKAKENIREFKDLPDAGTTQVLVLNEYIKKLNELKDIIKSYQDLLTQDISDMQKIYDDFVKVDTVQ